MKTHPYSPDPLKLLLLALAAMLPVAHADISGVQTRATISATAQVAINPTLTTPDLNPVRDDKRPPDQFDVLSFNQNLLTNAAKEGLSARGGSQQSTTLTSIASALSFHSSASTSSAATRSGDPLKDTFTGGAGSASFTFTFTVDGRSTFSLTGSASVETNGATESSESEIELSGQTTDGEEVDFDFKAKDGRRDPRTVNASRSGDLKPGTYTLSVFTLSTIDKTQPLSRSSYNCTFDVSSFPVPPQPPGRGQIHWAHRVTGSFSEAANWRPRRVPVKDATHEDTAIFDLGGSYTVTLNGTSPTVDVIRVENGSTLSMSGGTLNAVSPSLAAPSLIATGNAGLLLMGGTLNTASAILGNDAGSHGQVNVRNTGTHWEASGRLTVGGAGTGRLKVDLGGTLSTTEARLGGGSAAGVATISGEGSRWDSGDVTVGFSSEGTFSILDGGVVNSQDVKIGLGPINSGLSSAVVQGVNSSGNPSTWLVTTGLSVGVNDAGTLEILGGGIVKASPQLMNIGDLGRVHVGGVGPANTRSTLEAKGCSMDGGDAFLTIDGGGLVKFSDQVQIGGAGRGTVTVTGRAPNSGPRSELFFTAPDEEFHVGFVSGTVGILNIIDSGAVFVSCSAMNIGSVNSGTGLVIVGTTDPAAPASSLSVTGNLNVGGNPFAAVDAGAGVLVIVDGTVLVNGNVAVRDSGTIQGRGLLTVTGRLTNFGVITPGLSPGILTLAGDFEQDATGAVIAEIAGPTPGTQHDQFIVTGSATMGGRLVLQFMNGYAPKTGEHFDVLKMTGATTGDFATIDVLGLAPGAQFQTALSNGVFTATAMNDTAALPTVGIRAVTKRAFEKGKRGVALLVSRTGSKASKANPLTVRYTIGGTAENGIDYKLLTGSVTIPAHKNAVTLKLKPFDDSAVEGRETVEFTIIPGAEYTNSLKSKTSARIVSND